MLFANSCFRWRTSNVVHRQAGCACLIVCQLFSCNILQVHRFQVDRQIVENHNIHWKFSMCSSTKSTSQSSPNSWLSLIKFCTQSENFRSLCKILVEVLAKSFATYSEMEWETFYKVITCNKCVPYEQAISSHFINQNFHKSSSIAPIKNYHTMVILW